MTTKKAVTTAMVKRPSLMDYAIERREVIERIIAANGEITDEDDVALVGAEGNIENKSAGYLAIMDHLESAEKYAREQARIAQGFAQACARAADNLKNRLKTGLITAGMQKVKAGFRTVSITTYQPEMKIECSELPLDLVEVEFKIVEVKKPKDAEIRIRVGAGEEIKGVSFETKDPSIRITKPREAKETEPAAGEISQQEAA